MRDIKFRAWDKERKEFLSGGEVLIGIQNGRYPINVIYLDILKAPNAYKDRFILQQFTGLLDKNGKKIYEGDIVSLILIEDSARHWKTEAKAVVEWGHEDAGFYYFTTYDRFPHAKPWFTENVQVIGNIYENSELLK